MSELPPLPEPIEAWEFAPSAKLFTRDQIQAYARAAIEAAKAEQVRPDILENLSYHRLERDDLTLDNCLSYLAEGWRKVHGRTERQMVMQILELLAAAPTPEPMSAPTEAKPAQPCGHPESLLLKSAETGEPLYCEACDDKSGRRDAEQRETELLAANQALREKIAALSKPAQDAVDAELLDWLEAQINEHGAIHLHDGNNPNGHGLGLRPGSLNRSLREAIRAAISAKKGQP